MAVQAQLCSENFGFPLGGSQNWIDGAYGFNIDQNQQQQGLQNLRQKTQNPSFNNSGLFPNHNHYQELASSQSILAQIDNQRREVDQFISLQNERLRLVLQEQRKRQILLILRTYEAKAVALLKQKDEEIAKAVSRTGELEEFLRRMEIENQKWQRLANENEAMVESLNNTIEQFNAVGDAESWINRGERMGETGDNRGKQENEEQSTRKMVCKGCNSCNSCVVFLPCRHLCSCRDCQAFLDSCPVCGMVKKASIEAAV